jgi:hypothetical protein
MARRCHREMMQDQDCVLLARIEFDVDWVGGSPTGVWQIAGSPAAVIVDETTRPVLVHMRLLQEWLMCGCECGGLGLAAAPAGGGEFIPFARAGLGGGSVDQPPPRLPVAMVTASADLDDSHYCVIGTGGATMTLTLPASVPEITGRVYVIKNADAKLTVRTPAIGGDTIDDKLSLTVRKKGAVTLVADGEGGWQVIGLVGL